ncbi:MAG: hypothetical protein FRX48_08478 [Lasallia pustulata]|uniref:Synaptobrevin n=1 Tax=Lasallia pustulata TaxID=136370 RepID=A0A5M8PFG4_9LECA|nr:MAG: hypothetical protein FRX48_08478 [Lasallia pustulata]
MARAAALDIQPSDVVSINLTRLLSRLEHKILSSEPDPRLRLSSYERAKTSANVEHARTLLLQLEHESSAIKIQSRKQAAQTDLLQKRALIKRLTERLYNLSQLDDGDVADVSDGEDLLGEEEPLEKPALTTLSAAAEPPTPPIFDRRKDSPPPPASQLRSRHGPTSSSTTAHTETLLSHNRIEQEVITEELVSVAAAIKANANAMAADLQGEDREVLERAGQGLEKNTGGMEAAAGRIGLLRRMTEGKGWWGRMKLYAWLAALWVVALAVVFVMPKLRF